MSHAMHVPVTVTGTIVKRLRPIHRTIRRAGIRTAQQRKKRRARRPVRGLRSSARSIRGLTGSTWTPVRALGSIQPHHPTAVALLAVVVQLAAVAPLLMAVLQASRQVGVNTGASNTSGITTRTQSLARSLGRDQQLQRLQHQQGLHWQRPGQRQRRQHQQQEEGQASGARDGASSTRETSGSTLGLARAPGLTQLQNMVLHNHQHEHNRNRRHSRRRVRLVVVFRKDG